MCKNIKEWTIKNNVNPSIANDLIENRLFHDTDIDMTGLFDFLLDYLRFDKTYACYLLLRHSNYTDVMQALDKFIEDNHLQKEIFFK